MSDSPIFAAAAKNQVKVLRRHLEDKEAHMASDGYTPLCLAAFYGSKRCLRALVAAGCDVNQACTTDGATPAFIAAQNGHTECLRALVAAGCDVNQALTTDGRTPAFTAAANGHTECLRALVAAGGDVNQACTDGEAPMAGAARNDKLDCVKELVGAGAAVDTKYKGKTPLQLADSRGHTAVAAFLRDPVAMAAEVTRHQAQPSTIALISREVAALPMQSWGRPHVAHFVLHHAKCNQPAADVLAALKVDGRGLCKIGTTTALKKAGLDIKNSMQLAKAITERIIADEERAVAQAEAIAAADRETKLRLAHAIDTWTVDQVHLFFASVMGLPSVAKLNRLGECDGPMLLEALRLDHSELHLTKPDAKRARSFLKQQASWASLGDEQSGRRTVRGSGFFSLFPALGAMQCLSDSSTDASSLGSSGRSLGQQLLGTPDAETVDQRTAKFGPECKNRGYTKVALLQSGAFGGVYKVQKKTNGKPEYFAMKRIPCTDQNDLNSAFREASTLRDLSQKCPYIVRLVGEPFKDDRVLCIVTPLYSASLHSILDASLPTRPTPEKRIAMAAQLVMALAHVHSEGVIHRDIKAHNVLVSAGQATCVLADFGLAAVHGGQGERVGTDSYWAPEIREGGPCSRPADVWALGLVLLELVLGHRLSQHVVLDVPKAIMGEDSENKVSSFLKEGDIGFTGAAVSLKQTIFRMLNKNPELRITTKELVNQPFVKAVKGNIEACAELAEHMTKSKLMSSRVVEKQVKKNKSLNREELLAVSLNEARANYRPSVKDKDSLQQESEIRTLQARFEAMDIKLDFVVSAVGT